MTSGRAATLLKTRVREMSALPAKAKKIFVAVSENAGTTVSRIQLPVVLITLNRCVGVVSSERVSV
jgi:hypothetical protein